METIPRMTLIWSKAWTSLPNPSIEAENSSFLTGKQLIAMMLFHQFQPRQVLNRNGNHALQALMSEQCLSEGWPVPAAPNPRKPFRDMVCAVMYSVDTEARNDQDVERNITAATLVAEEIEFLGGKAILENIFARPPSVRDSVESGIVMEQVDVAFVLAPWTPSEKRIARLISFVDQGHPTSFSFLF